MKQSHQISIASKSSVRKPLKDLSNNNGSFLRSVNPKKISMPAKEIDDKQSVVRAQEEEQKQQQQDDDCLDHLLLVQSDLSSLTRQVLTSPFKTQSSIYYISFMEKVLVFNCF